jgi:hypothetical protein
MIDVPQEEADYATVPAPKVQDTLCVSNVTGVAVVQGTRKQVDPISIGKRLVARPVGPLSLDFLVWKTREEVSNL